MQLFQCVCVCVYNTYYNCRPHLMHEWTLHWSPLCSENDKMWFFPRPCLLQKKVTNTVKSAGFRCYKWFLRHCCLPQTSSSQLQPRSWLISASDGGDGGVTSSGMLGWKGGSFSMSFRLPCVPLFGTGFNPNKSKARTIRGHAIIVVMITSVLLSRPGVSNSSPLELPSCSF